MQNKLPSIAVVALLGRSVMALVLTFVSTGGSAEATPWVESPCDIAVSDPAVAARLRCGTVQVARDPANAAAGHFELAVVVKRSANPQAGAAPVLILHGGPGGEYTRYMGSAAPDFVAGRDTVAFDMRGGGRSGPLFCRALPQMLLAAQRTALEGGDARAAREAAVTACAQEFAEQGLKPGDFGTDRNVEDAEAVRQALGIPRWSVYGVSYGTTAAAHYLAQHPSAIEAVVLDSPYPPDQWVFSVREAQSRVIDRLLGECRADAACAARFPALDRARAEAALLRLSAEPLPFHLGGRRYQADEATVRAALHGLLETEDLARTLPWFLNAVVQRDGDALAGPLGLSLLAGDVLLQRSDSLGALIATDCRDRPRHHAQPSGGPQWMDLLGGLPSSTCQAWPLGTPPGVPDGSSVSVLMLLAGYDGFQPDGAAMAEVIGPAASVLSFAHVAHVVRGAGECPRGIVSDFLRNPAATLDTSCIDTMAAPGFLLDATPMPAAVALGVRLGAGTPSVAMWGVAAGAILWLLAGLIAPAFGAIWRRVRRLPGAGGSTAPAALAGCGGLLVLLGGALPLGLTLQYHAGAAAYGVQRGLEALFWGVPLGGLLAVAALLLAGRAGQKQSGLAALGGILMAAGLMALGLWPQPSGDVDVDLQLHTRTVKHTIDWSGSRPRARPLGCAPAWKP